LALAPRQRLLRRLAPTLDEGPLDVVFGEKLNNGFHDFGGHEHRLDQIVACICERFTFSRIGRHGENFVRLS
jgi:hypothetical protein